MKFVTFKLRDKEYPGVLDKEEKSVYSLDKIFGVGRFKTLVDFIGDSKEEHISKIEATLEEKSIKAIPLDEVSILSPITKPVHDIICVGVNYADHLKESQAAIKDGNLEKVTKPVYFSKRTTRIVGPDENIEAEIELDEEFDYEVELAVIIGKAGKDIALDKVEDHIFGYSIFNDLSSRRLQRDHIQWYKGKSLDGYSVMGPVVLHKSQLPFPMEVDVISKVNDEIRQNSNTRMLINDIATLISDFSKGITLEPGDIIATGTPAGVGMALNPPRYMVKGDVVQCEIPEIGVLRNKII
ncbi:fumarylacetoacetate hydrolase family protein [Gudongella sp. DL1XJH-153]|uniref:fumarylacetoacetate hydrolase family protein n=1 Tax=Gudongella sp. DL1XJH-153 TaxID=3409804 RepID=UPI003BB7CFAB